MLLHVRRSTRSLLSLALAAAVLGGLPRVLQAQDEEAVAAPKVEKPFSLMSAMLLGKRDSVAVIAREQVGLRYKYGAKQPGKAFDCSGLVQYVMAALGVDVPRTARDQAKMGDAVPKDPEQLQVGDLLYFGRGKRVTHIGIYVGDGRYVHAANRRAGVIESTLPAPGTRRSSHWWRGVRRLLHLPDSTTADTAITNRLLDSAAIAPVPQIVTGSSN